MRQFVLRLNKEQGTTVILTTHDMDDIEALCQRVVVIDKGKLYCDGDLDELRRRVGSGRRLTVDLEHPAPLRIEGAEVVETDGARVVLAFDPEEIAPATLIARVTDRHPVRDLFVENPPIEEIVARLYGDAEEP